LLSTNNLLNWLLEPGCNNIINRWLSILQIIKDFTTAKATITLSGNAPFGGLVVSLESDETAASVPSSITVPEGLKTATFKTRLPSLSQNRPFTCSRKKKELFIQMRLPYGIVEQASVSETLHLMARRYL
jgi:hypothetical protein